MNCKMPLFEEQAGSYGLKKYGTHRFQRVMKILSEFTKLSNTKLLDDGCGYGYSSVEFSSGCKSVIGIDINKNAIKNADEMFSRKNLSFKVANGEKLPFQRNVFDVVVSFQVLQYVSDKKSYIDEAYRVMKKNSILYLAVPNYFFPIEPHFRIPFLHFLPKFVSNIIARRYGFDYYYITMPTYWSVKKMLEEKNFQVVDYTKKIISDPEKHGLKKDMPGLYTLVKWFPFLGFFTPLSPSFVFICKKI